MAKVKEAVKEQPSKEVPIVTKEVSTRPVLANGFLIPLKVVKDMSGTQYAVSVGEIGYFPKHVADVLIAEGKAVKA